MARSRGPDAWPVRGETYWCQELNIPMVGRECPDGGRGQFVNVTDPGDVRPAFSYDLKRLEDGYRFETGSLNGFDMLRGYSVVVFNKVPFMDLMYEVVADGRIIGRLYWDPQVEHWRFRFSYPGIARVWHLEPLPRIKVNGSAKTLKRKWIYENTLGLPPGAQVAFEDVEGEPLGIGYVHPESGKVKVHTIFWRRPEPYASKRRSTWSDVIKANDYYLYYHSARAVKFIHVMNEKVNKPVIVSYSGGKDSLAALNLTLEAGIKPYVLFNDTGIELPETRESVARIVEEKGLELLVADAGDAFWRAVEAIGPPGKDYRWCCKVTKLAPLSRLLQERFPDGALNIVGQRAYESLDRARSPRVWRNRWLPQILNISPIQYWTQLLVWLYIWSRRLPYNPLYERGFDRIGCFMCPAAFTAEYRHVEETHPDLWRKWEGVLWRWAERIGLEGPSATLWVRKGLWRWLTPAPQKGRLARRIGLNIGDWKSYYKKWLRPSLKYFAYGEGARAELDEPLPVESIEDQYTVLGSFKVESRREDEIVLKGPSRVKVVFTGDRIEVEGAKGVLARELALDTLKLAFRWYACAGCKACEASCPTGAIKVVREGDGYRPIVDEATCIHCKLCLDNCPLADVTVERIYSALALGEPTAWRRAGRRSRESVIRRYLELKGYKIPSSDAKMVDEDTLTMPPGLAMEEEGNG
ncbi:MAG: phosphoadenosine phosphosulfate reductase family protein [Desulfurococcales archaeon]|nr:phosphoadenosine phosphosulfate reductase family protein [Desulfurococcales archaeon]